MNILGLSGVFDPTPSAALYVDNTLVAAAEETSFRHIEGNQDRTPLEAARFCLASANLCPEDIQVVAIPYAETPLNSPARWQFAKRHWYSPKRSINAVLQGNLAFSQYKDEITKLLQTLGINASNIQFDTVDKHVAYASSAYHLSGFRSKTAIIGMGDQGEYASMFFGFGEHGRIHEIKQYYFPDCLSFLYDTMSSYFGFDGPNAVSSTITLAAQGNPNRYDLSRLLHHEHGDVSVNTDYVNVSDNRRYQKDDRFYHFTRQLVDWLGPVRDGKAELNPYSHYAASIQQLFEKTIVSLVKENLGDIIDETGRLVFAGSGASNYKLNQTLLAQPNIKHLWVPPTGHNALSAIGAATHACATQGIVANNLKHAFLGPTYTSKDCKAACEAHSETPHYKPLKHQAKEAARLLCETGSIAWFQGAMELGNQASGARSILTLLNHSTTGLPPQPCRVSMLDHTADTMLNTSHRSAFFNMSYEIAETHRHHVTHLLQPDGTLLAQTVTQDYHPAFYALLQEVEALTGIGAVLHSSLVTPNNTLATTPKDALDAFYQSELSQLIMEDLLVTK
ncbi:hypothetical protein A9Q99_26180 [Gammaproteobacteria bacterium 45_16_T64]|nr:hypothetical protein A9Q99_26180 [Gammaproteobacteria bacterium 45_16_T64]